MSSYKLQRCVAQLFSIIASLVIQLNVLTTMIIMGFTFHMVFGEKRIATRSLERPIKLLNSYVALYLHVPTNWKVEQKLEAIAILRLLIVMNTSSEQPTILLAASIDAQHPHIISLTFWAGIVYTLCDWFLNSPCFT